MKAEKLSDPVKLKITDHVRVAGKICKPGDVVTLSGNDKVQLLATGKAERAADKEEAKK